MSSFKSKWMDWPEDSKGKRLRAASLKETAFVSSVSPSNNTFWGNKGINPGDRSEDLIPSVALVRIQRTDKTVKNRPFEVEHRHGIASESHQEKKSANDEAASNDPAFPTIESDWPPECIESEKLMGMRYARLFPLLGQEVQIPSGRGMLLQVFEKRVMVEAVGKIRFLSPNQVFPIGTTSHEQK